DAGGPPAASAARFVWPPAPPAPTAEAHEAPAARPAPRGPVDAPLQQDVLCTVAEEKLRQGWRKDRDETAANLRRSLADDAEQLRNVADNARRLADASGFPR